MRNSYHSEKQSAQHISSGLAGLPPITPCPERDRQRETLERFISRVFHASYGARILEFLPLLIHSGPISSPAAALGLRGAAHGKLFCECYLDSTIEEEVLKNYGVRADRHQLMELGNLVSNQPGQAVLLYLVIVGALSAANVTHLLFAANLAVQQSISRSGFTPIPLRAANPENLGMTAKNWGSYYEGAPMVMLADIDLTYRQARANRKLSALLDYYVDTIDELADAIEGEK